MEINVPRLLDALFASIHLYSTLLLVSGDQDQAFANVFQASV